MKLLSTLVMAAFLAGNVAPAFALEAAPKTEKPAKAKKAHKAKADAKAEKPAAKPAAK